MQPELIVDYANTVGEGPLWHPDDKKLYWVDIPPGKIYRHDPVTGNSELFFQGPTGIGGYTIQADGSLLCFTYNAGVGLLKDGRWTWVVEVLTAEQGRKFNDVIADPAGRVFAGTIVNEQGRGALYRMDLDATLTVVETDIGISNGMGFSLDHRLMYYTDTETQRIDVFDYDVDTGNLSNRRPFVDTGDGWPDGMTVDADGYVWSAGFGKSGITRYAPDGSFDRKVDVPMQKTTSIIFAGDHLTDAYVTSGGGEDKAESGEYAGALYRLDMSGEGVKGLPEFRSRIAL
jgi:sugar lactone lactonase YvrE